MPVALESARRADRAAWGGYRAAAAKYLTGGVGWGLDDVDGIIDPDDRDAADGLGMHAAPCGGAGREGLDTA
jgi:hypothetical protein